MYTTDQEGEKKSVVKGFDDSRGIIQKILIKNSSQRKE